MDRLIRIQEKLRAPKDKKSQGEKDVFKYRSAEDILEAASIAAFHSKASTSENVPVDYVPIRFVKKPAGAKPGMVIFTNNRTVYVTPKEGKKI